MRLPPRLLGLVLLCTMMPVIAPSAARGDAQPAWVPPYPGPAPTSWPSVLQYEQYASARAQQLEARQHALTSAGRSGHYRLQRGLLLTAVAFGAGMALAGFWLLWTRPSEEPDAPHASRAATLLMLGGVGLTLASGVAAHGLQQNHPHRDEIARLRQERHYWRREAKRVRRTRTSPGFDVSLRGLGLHASF